MVVVCSDTIAAGKKEDRAGKAIVAKLEQSAVAIEEYVVIPDEVERIQAKVKEAVARGTDMIIFTGGTGLSVRDVTPEALRPLIERDIPGVSEAIRAYGQQRTPYSMPRAASRARSAARSCWPCRDPRAERRNPWTRCSPTCSMVQHPHRRTARVTDIPEGDVQLQQLP